MTRAQVEYYISEGYAVVVGGKPLFVEGDIWEYLDTLDEEEGSVLVLEDLLKWSDEELASLDF